MNKQIVIDYQNVSKSYQDGHLTVDELHDLIENDEISFEEFRKRALEAGKKYG